MERIRYLPEWETPINPPKRKKSLLTQLKEKFPAPTGAPSLPKRSSFMGLTRPRASSSVPSLTDNSVFPNEKPPVGIGRTSTNEKNGRAILPTYATAATTTGTAPPVNPMFSAATPPSPTASSANNGWKSKLHTRFDTLLPPDRRYVRNRFDRRRFLLFIILPLVLLALLALVLGLGLGLGLRNGSSDLDILDDGKVYTGDLTYYDLGGAESLGACGLPGYDNFDNVVSISKALFDKAAETVAGAKENPNLNPLCGRSIRVQLGEAGDDNNNREVVVTIIDRCVGCAPQDLDLSRIALMSLGADLAQGRVRGNWAWID